MKILILFCFLNSLGISAHAQSVQYGVRPFFLIEAMQPSELKDRLSSCKNQLPSRSYFSIAHRGAPLFFPEHTAESFTAANLMGAGIFECDVTFTKDKKLVCRHAQNDLHSTTNILKTNLSKKCSRPFIPASENSDAVADCRTTDLTLEEFQTLKGKMDSFSPKAKTIDEYMDSTPSWRSDLYVNNGGTVLTHRQSIELIKSFGGKFIPELKRSIFPLPFDGFGHHDFAQALINEYKDLGVPPRDVFPQSFYLPDILYWIEHEPEFGKQAILLDDGSAKFGVDPQHPDDLNHRMHQLYRAGVRYIGSPIWILLTLNDDNEIIPSNYARAAKENNLKIIAWSLERDGPLISGGGWYHQSIKKVLHDDSQVYLVLDVLAQKVGVSGVFSDWPATVTYYANCLKLE